MFITQFTSEFTKNGLQLFPWSTSNECRPHRSDASSHERYTPLRPVVTVASSLCKCQKKGWILWPPAWSRAPCLLPDSKVTSEGVAEPLIHWVKSVQLIKSLSPVSVPIIPNILTILVFGDPIPAVIISSEFRHSVELSIAHYSMTDSMKGGPNLIRNLFLQCQKGVTNSNFQQLQLLYPRDQLFFSRLLRWKTKAIADPNTWLQCYPLNGPIHVCILSCSMTLYV